MIRRACLTILVTAAGLSADARSQAAASPGAAAEPLRSLDELFGAEEPFAGDFADFARRALAGVAENPDRLETAVVLALLARQESGHFLGHDPAWLPLVERALAQPFEEGFLQDRLREFHTGLLRAADRGREAAALAEARGFVWRWASVGPFSRLSRRCHDQRFDPERALDLAARWEHRGRPVAWRAPWDERLAGWPDDDLAPWYLRRHEGAVSLLAQVSFDEEADGGIELFGRPLAKLWVNDAPVLDLDPARGLHEPSARVPVRFRRGWNRLLLKVSAGGGATFRLRLIDRQGGALLPGRTETELVLHPLAEGPAPTPAPPLTRSSMRARLAAEAPESPARAAALALLSAAAGFEDDAIFYAERAHRRAPDHRAYRLFWADTLLTCDYYPPAWRTLAATKLLAPLVRSKPAAVPVVLNAAGVLHQNDKTQEAIRLLESARETRPQAWLLDWQIATFAQRRDWDFEARAARARVLERAPHFTPALWEEARDLLRHRHPREAVRVLQRLLAIDARRSDDALRLLGEVCEMQGRSEPLLALVDRLLARQPDLWRLRRERAELLAALGRFEEANAAWKELAALDPDDAEVPLGLAALAERRGRLAEARRWCEAALAIDPSRLELRRRIARLDAQLTGEVAPDLRSLPSLREGVDPPAGEAHPRAGVPQAAPPDPLIDFAEPWRRDVAAAIAAAPGREAYPDAATLLVIDQMVVRVFEDGSFAAVVHTLHKILSAEGEERQSEVRNQGELLEVRTWRPDGRVFEPQPVQGRFEMPQVQLGGFVEHRYAMQGAHARGEPIRLPTFYFQDHAFETPFLYSEFVVIAPEDLPLEVHEFHLLRPAEVTRQGGLVTRRWLVTDSPRRQPERFAPEPEAFLPHVVLGTFKSLTEQMAEWGDRAFPRRPSSRPILARARELLGEDLGARLPVRERLTRVLRFVNETVEGYGTGSSPEATLFEKKGSRDQLVRALLEAAGIEVYTARVKPRPELLTWRHTAIPGETGFQGAHSFVLDEQGAPLFFTVDPRLGPSFDLPWALQGGEALLVLPEGLRWHQLPAAGEDAAERQTWETALTLSAAGTVHAQGRHVAHALDAYGWKDAVKDFDAFRRERVGHQLLRGRLPGATAPRFEFPDAERPGAPFCFAFEMDLPTYATGDDERRELPLGFEPLELTRQLADKAARTLPYEFRGATAMDDTVTVRAEGGWRVTARPADHIAVGPWGSYHLRCEGEGDEVRITRRVRLRPFTLPAAEYPGLVRFCREVDQAESQRLVYTRAAAGDR